MNRNWPAEALSYQETVARAFHALGGVELARKAELNREFRASTVRPVLEQLDLLTLDIWGDEAESAAAVLAVKEAGAVVLPWPLTHGLAVPAGVRDTVDGFYLTNGPVRRLDHADLFDRAIAFDTDASTAHVLLSHELSTAPLDPFAVAVDMNEQVTLDDSDHAVTAHYLLDAFWVAGACRTTVELAARHARDRNQFGVPIGNFGEIRWHLADMVLARDGLDELALHTWWEARRGRAGLVDLLALRLNMIEAATTVLSHGHQVLAAMGLCEEHDLTMIDRHVQSALRRPGGALKTTRQLAESIATDGFAGTFAVEPWSA
ncbi:acyl-CoA dehydrogenase family protein [Rhodococcus sp. NPDC003318]|uniref:acyl-CoA dehydrogenase family protein n=1 Tax=Rhodococcus sp. NPDC003318 TaxID=3364503 RepID=UPI0036B47031